jgi:hypothetical protein
MFSIFENWNLRRLFDIGEKLVSVGKFLIPGVAIFTLLKNVFASFWEMLGDWFEEKILFFLTAIKDQIATLGVDLTPPPLFQEFIGKANTIVPLDEAWKLLLIYLAFASVVMGIKWGRNLIPGMT